MQKFNPQSSNWFERAKYEDLQSNMTSQQGNVRQAPRVSYRYGPNIYNDKPSNQGSNHQMQFDNFYNRPARDFQYDNTDANQPAFTSDSYESKSGNYSQTLSNEYQNESFLPRGTERFPTRERAFIPQPASRAQPKMRPQNIEGSANSGPNSKKRKAMQWQYPDEVSSHHENFFQIPSMHPLSRRQVKHIRRRTRDFENGNLIDESQGMASGMMNVDEDFPPVKKTRGEYVLQYKPPTQPQSGSMQPYRGPIKPYRAATKPHRGAAQPQHGPTQPQSGPVQLYRGPTVPNQPISQKKKKPAKTQPHWCNACDKAFSTAELLALHKDTLNHVAQLKAHLKKTLSSLENDSKELNVLIESSGDEVSNPAVCALCDTYNINPKVHKWSLMHLLRQIQGPGIPLPTQLNVKDLEHEDDKNLGPAEVGKLKGQVNVHPFAGYFCKLCRKVTHSKSAHCISKRHIYLCEKVEERKNNPDKKEGEGSDVEPNDDENMKDVKVEENSV